MEYLVIGESVSGVAAAHALAAAGLSVVLLTTAGVTGSLRDAHSVAPTPLTDSPMPGAAFRDVSFAALVRTGRVRIDEELLDAEQLEIHVDKSLTLRSFQGREFIVSGAVFAPHGYPTVPIGLPSRAELSEYSWGGGVIFSATADPRDINSRHLVILGSGAYALEQAANAARKAGQVNVLLSCYRSSLEKTSPAARQLIGQVVPALPNVNVHFGCRYLRLHQDEAGRIDGVLFENSGGPRELRCELLFPADGPSPMWEFFGDVSQAKRAIESGGLYPVGLAAGVEYGDYPRMWRDGIRIANEILGDGTITAELDA